MTGPDFKSAQLTLGLNNAQMAAWLGVSLRTVEQWRATGPSKLGARAVGLALRVADLHQALAYADAVLGRMEPPDARAFSDEYVALASALCDIQNDEGRAILARATAHVNDLPPPAYPEVEVTYPDGLALDWRE